MSSYLDEFKKLATTDDKLQEGVFVRDSSEEDAEGAEGSGRAEGETDESIDLLQLSVRASNCLKRANIYTIGDLVAHTETDLSKIRNLGRKSVDEIIVKLRDFGHELKSNDE